MPGGKKKKKKEAFKIRKCYTESKKERTPYPHKATICDPTEKKHKNVNKKSSNHGSTIMNMPNSRKKKKKKSMTGSETVLATVSRASKNTTGNTSTRSYF